MKTPHTPGPWNAHQPGFKGLVSGIVRDKQNRFVATAASPATGEYNRDENEIDANARLIAAAPELLEALENIVSQNLLNSSIKGFDKAQKAINKVKGLEKLAISNPNLK